MIYTINALLYDVSLHVLHSHIYTWTPAIGMTFNPK